MKKTLKVAAVAVLLSGGGAVAAECSADAVTAGEKVFKACAVCHKVEDGKNGAGPHLFGIVGRDIASVERFKYSKAMKAHGEANGAWTAELLDAYLENPRKNVKGTRMAYPGLKKADKRAELICYLESIG